MTMAVASVVALGLPAAASAQPHAITGYVGTGEIQIGTSGKWCLAVKGVRNDKPEAGLLVYGIACGTPGYEQEWSIAQFERNGILVGEVSPLNNLSLCMGESETTSNVAVQECSSRSPDNFLVRFIPIGRSQGFLDLWLIQQPGGNVVSTKSPIKSGRYMQWFRKSNSLAQVLQFPPLTEVQEV